MNKLIAAVILAFALVVILSDSAMAGGHLYRHHDFGKVHTWDNGLVPQKYHHGGYGGGYGGYGGGYGGYGGFGGYGGYGGYGGHGGYGGFGGPFGGFGGYGYGR